MQEIKILCSPSNKNSKVEHIIFAADSIYLQHLYIAIQSLLCTNQKFDFIIHIIHQSFTPQDLQLLKDLANRSNKEIKFHYLNKNPTLNLKTGFHFTNACYYRLFIPEILDSNIEKALYLDSDIIINNDISTIFNIDLKNSFLAAVEDRFDRHVELGMKKNSKYFNSGVMLINTRKWREEELCKKVIHFVKENSTKILYPDQDGLNAVIDNNWIAIPPKFNQMSFFYENDRPKIYNQVDFLEALKDPVIIHFTGSYKPWFFATKHKFKKLYWRYLKMTPFKNYRQPDKNLINFISSATPKGIKRFLRNSLRQISYIFPS